jgi:hypothetical protein
MFWAGTRSDPNATCFDCKHYGYICVVRNDAGNAIETRATIRPAARDFGTVSKVARNRARENAFTLVFSHTRHTILVPS